MNVINTVTIWMKHADHPDGITDIDLSIIGDDKEAWYSDFGFEVKVWDEEIEGIGRDIPIGAIVSDLEDEVCPNPAMVLEKSDHPAGKHHIAGTGTTVYEYNDGRYPAYDDVYTIQFLVDALNGRNKTYDYPSNRLYVIEQPYTWAEKTWHSGLYNDVVSTLRNGISMVNGMFGTYPNGELVRQDNGKIQ